MFLMFSADGIYHSEDLFDEHNSFRPERFLHSEYGTKPGADTTGLRSDLHFGSGRVSQFYAIYTDPHQTQPGALVAYMSRNASGQ